MNSKNCSDGIFLSAAEDAKTARLCQPDSASNKLAFSDEEFLLRDELRSVRIQLEWLKPDLMQLELGIESTVVIFGSARFPDPDTAQRNFVDVEALLASTPDDPTLLKKLKTARRVVANSRYYNEARQLARKITEASISHNGKEFVIVTGGGPGVMEAANRGAADAGGKSIGLNIVLPKEQKPNPYISPELCFQFHYFALRKMHFLKRAVALIALPGGFGTLDELFDALTLVQTHKIKGVPIILLGVDYWKNVINFDYLLEQGAIEEVDLDLFEFVETADEAYEILKADWQI